MTGGIQRTTQFAVGTKLRKLALLQSEPVPTSFVTIRTMSGRPEVNVIIHPSGKFDNNAEVYQHIEAVPLAAAMGAEIRGANLAALTDAQFAEIECALFRHKMIFFREQEITHGDQEAFSSRLGPFAEDAYTKGIDGHPNVQPVIKEADEKVAMIFGSGWHTDSPFLPQPPAISLLYGVDIPPFGGDTIWANSALAYQMLSDMMQRTLEPFRVHMSMKNVLATAQAVMEPNDTAIGRMLSPAGANPPAHGRERLVLRPHLRGGHRGDDGGRVGVDPRFSGRAHHPTGFHLPPALGAKNARDVGQPIVSAPGVQRSRRLPARAVPDHDRRGDAGLTPSALPNPTRPTVLIVGASPGTGKSTIAGRMHTQLERTGLSVLCWYGTEVSQGDRADGLRAGARSE
jgi:taurine dioxygenase